MSTDFRFNFVCDQDACDYNYFLSEFGFCEFLECDNGQVIDGVCIQCPEGYEILVISRDPVTAYFFLCIDSQYYDRLLDFKMVLQNEPDFTYYNNIS
jgi:hypothetical protein